MCAMVQNHTYWKPRLNWLESETKEKGIGISHSTIRSLASRLQPQVTLPCGQIWIFPDAAWSRRVHRAYGNIFASTDPERAHAVLAPHTQGGYTVSVRAPLLTMRGADKLCRLFHTEGGRSAAAGINVLPYDQLPAFIRAFDETFCS
jgi:hypothetical protein